jgi:hypothetical protein
MPTQINLASFAPMQADKPYRAALCQRMPTSTLLAFFGARRGILSGLRPAGARPIGLPWELGT